MNWKKFVLLGCMVAGVFAASTATAQMRGGHRASMARMPMRGAPMRNSAFGFHRFNDRDFDRDDGFRRFHRFNDGDFDRDDGFRRFHHHHFNDIFIFDNFGFPFFPFFPPPSLLSVPSVLVLTSRRRSRMEIAARTDTVLFPAEDRYDSRMV